MMTTLAEARLRACKLWPYGSHAILSLVPVPKPGLGTMAVDQHWRLYFDSETLNAQSSDESAGTILHEVSHLLLKHHVRGQRLVAQDADQTDWDRWNVATDYAINSMLRQQGIGLRNGVLYPEQAGFDQCLSGEEYFRMLAKANNKQSRNAPDAQQQSSEQAGNHDLRGTSKEREGPNSAHPAVSHGDQRTTGMERPASAPGSGDGGSCSDGRQRSWEIPPPPECDIPGLKPHEADIIVRETAERILDKERGEGSGAWKCWAQNVLNPRVDPRLALLRMVRQAVEATSGHGDYSYRRPNRRNPRRDMVLPSAVQPIPRITVIVDTSGSMDQRDLGLSLGLIGKVLNSFRIRDGIRVVCGDTQAVNSAKVFDPKQVSLAGGGGTHMGKLIQQVAESKPKPQLIVVCTDGATPWCEPVGIPVVACVTQESRAKRVPSWIKTVILAE